MKACRVSLLILSCFLFVTTPCSAHEPVVEVDSKAMREAVIKWRESLGPELTKKATFKFDGPERTDWHFIPKDRLGVSWKEMNLDQRRAAHAILRTALSSQGFFKAMSIMSLDEELRKIEADRPDVIQRRDPEKYWFAIFGDPAGDEPWGWRVEGHHLSLNFSSVTGQVVSVTPAFFGTNPAELRTGPRAGLRILGAEEDLAREIITSCSDEQLKTAIILDAAPADIIGMPGIEIKFGEPDGLAFDDMTSEQQALLKKLLLELLGNYEAEIKDSALHELEHAGWDKLHFGWAGSTKFGEGHYFRIHGPTLVIEYDNTQNNANHAHLVWHSPGNNFAADFLKKHYEESPHHQGAEETMRRALNKKVDLVLDDVVLDEFIGLLQKDYGLIVMISNDSMPESYRELPVFTCEFRNKELGETLHQILQKEGFDYVIDDEVVLILGKEEMDKLSKE